MIKSCQNNLKNYFSRFVPINYRRGQTIIRPEDTPQGIYYVKKGFVRVYNISEAGKETTLNLLTQGDCFPLVWAICESPNNYFFEAYTNCILYRSPRGDLIRFLKNSKSELFNLIKTTLLSINSKLNIINYLLGGSAKTKVAATLYNLARQFDKKAAEKIEINLPLTHNSIATLTGLTRETISLIMEEFVKEGIINYKGRKIVIEDVEKLMKETF